MVATPARRRRAAVRSVATGAILEAGVSLPDSPTEIAIAGAGSNARVRLTPEEQREFTRLAGETINQRVSAIINSESYKRMPPERRKIVFENAVRAGREAARGRTLRAMGTAEMMRRVRDTRERQRAVR